jgi:hypothetical protein
VDHIDLERKNNKWSNLREADHRLNTINRRVLRCSRSGIKGIVLTPNGTWAARIRTPNGRKHLGTFKTKEAAGAAYAAAAKEIFGEFARTA